jgi:hypothetical protein
MASPQELSDKIAAVKADVESFKSLVLVYIAEVNALTARFLAKLAAGNDTQSAIDQLNTISLSDLSQQLQSAIDQAKIEGQ